MGATHHITTVSGTTQTLALFVLALVAGSFVSLVTVHFLDRGVNPISMAVSDYGAREHAWFYRLAAIWLGFAGLLTAVMLGDAMFPKPTLTILLLLVFATARWAITIFPADIEGEDDTSVGRSHLVLAVVAFGAIAIAAGTFNSVIDADAFWKSHLTLLGWLGGFVVAAAALAGLSRQVFLTEYFGVFERLLYLAMFAWFAAIALILL
jgi:hypothetical protein